VKILHLLFLLSILGILTLLAGCVSVGYLQKEIKEARQDERARFQRLLEEYRTGQISREYFDYSVAPRRTNENP
jgi:type II secretory pathway pseudopilin PulG